MLRIKGFTLIELLVVIAIIVLLMALLLPTLQRVGRQAKAVACQANQHQWGLAFSMYTTDHNGKFFGASGLVIGYMYDTNDMLLCPMVMKHKERPDDPLALTDLTSRTGGKFSAWTHAYPGKETIYGSYGINDFIRDDCHEYFWRTPSAKNIANTPVYLDCIEPCAGPLPHDAPPDYDDSIGSRMSYFCINRHDGGINSLFMDWSVRKVGLKELWILKWHRKFDTSGPWTRAGGVQPEDWPEWMRNFKDY
jgi:prepilin-type N-terminal cleavage/methylation domain-containing protein/prepilin-type processing-associated H-X9-DG protein